MEYPKTGTATNEFPIGVWYTYTPIYCKQESGFWQIGYKIIPAKDMWKEFIKMLKINKWNTINHKSEKEQPKKENG